MESYTIGITVYTIEYIVKLADLEENGLCNENCYSSTATDNPWISLTNLKYES